MLILSVFWLRSVASQTKNCTCHLKKLQSPTKNAILSHCVVACFRERLINTMKVKYTSVTGSINGHYNASTNWVNYQFRIS